jgi:hypothetical protein
MLDFAFEAKVKWEWNKLSLPAPSADDFVEIMTPSRTHARVRPQVECETCGKTFRSDSLKRYFLLKAG